MGKVLQPPRIRSEQNLRNASTLPYNYLSTMIRNPMIKGIALAAGTLALVAASANGATVQTWKLRK